jgi:hypothetical protein
MLLAQDPEIDNKYAKSISTPRLLDLGNQINNSYDISVLSLKQIPEAFQLAGVIIPIYI